MINLGTNFFSFQEQENNENMDNEFTSTFNITIDELW